MAAKKTTAVRGATAAATKKSTTTVTAKANQAAVDAEAAERKADAAESRAKRAEAKLEKLKVVTVGRSIAGRQVQGFVDFLREQSVVGLAIGLVLGTQVKVVVDQMIASFFNPLIGLFLPGKGGLEDKVFHLTIAGKTADFGWGAFASVMITFIIVAAIVYYVFKGLGLDKLDKKKDS